MMLTQTTVNWFFSPYSILVLMTKLYEDNRYQDIADVFDKLIKLSELKNIEFMHVNLWTKALLKLVSLIHP